MRGNDVYDITDEFDGKSVAEIQTIIDADKYNRSAACGYDLCGAYSPFCASCDKSLTFPCAEAYMKTLPAENGAEEAKAEKRRIRIAVARRKLN